MHRIWTYCRDQLLLWEWLQLTLSCQRCKNISRCLINLHFNYTVSQRITLDRSCNYVSCSVYFDLPNSTQYNDYVDYTVLIWDKVYGKQHTFLVTMLFLNCFQASLPSVYHDVDIIQRPLCEINDLYNRLSVHLTFSSLNLFKMQQFVKWVFMFI